MLWSFFSTSINPPYYIASSYRIDDNGRIQPSADGVPFAPQYQPLPQPNGKWIVSNGNYAVLCSSNLYTASINNATWYVVDCSQYVQMVDGEPKWAVSNDENAYPDGVYSDGLLYEKLS